MDVERRLNSMRLTEDEMYQLVDYGLSKVTPKSTTEVKLISYGELYDDAHELAISGNKMRGISTGFPSLDLMTRGLGGGDIIVIYGYTSMGKSQLSQNIALNVASAGQLVLFIGLELTNVQNEERFIKMGGTNANLPILYANNPSIGYKDIAGTIAVAKKDGLELVIVDQLQDLIHATVNEQGEIGQIMAELKRAAITHDIPIIVVSHVNRTGAQPGPPPLETLKGSASIEQKADIALSVWQDHDAEYGEVGYREMHVALRKNRQRGMEHKFTKLKITTGMKLVEAIDISGLTSIMPGAKAV